MVLLSGNENYEKIIGMENVKKIVVNYLEEQVEIFERMAEFKAICDNEGSLTAKQRYEWHDLMSRAHRYAEKGQLKEILLSEPHVDALVLLVKFAIDDFYRVNPMVKIVDYELFVKRVSASVLNGMFNFPFIGE